MGRVGVRPPLPFLWLSLNGGGVLVELLLLRERHVHQEARWRGCGPLRLEATPVIRMSVFFVVFGRAEQALVVGYGTAPCRAY